MKLHNAKNAVECQRIEMLLDGLPKTPRAPSGKLNRYRVKFSVGGMHNRHFSRIVKAPTPELAAEEIKLFHGDKLRVVLIEQR